MDDAKGFIDGVAAKSTTPSSIVRYLDHYVIGQDDAKKTVAVAVYSHYKKLAQSRDSSIEIAKSNILLIGPTGTGKTLLCETLSKGLKVPFVTADATSLAQSKYVNEEIEAILLRLLDRVGGNIAKAQRGIIFIDEIDKLKMAGGESVQHSLLKIMEGARVKLGNGQDIDTTDILFICGGTFVGLENITARTHSYGFISTSEGDSQNILDRLNSRTKPTDLFEFGLIPEFAGRLPIIASFGMLSKEMLVKIMIEPRNSIYNQFKEILKNEGVDLAIEVTVFEQIAELAFEYKVGARSIRGIFEQMISPILYVVPDRPEIRRVVIRSLFDEPSMITE